MGAKTTKLFQTPDSIQKRLKPKLETKDPRSPDVLRTPLNELNANSEKVENSDGFRDPRSPTTCINRTPIIFESDQSKSFVFEEDDTFNELFTKNPNPKQTTNKPVVEVDPRSPTIEINRTPLIFDESISLELPPITFSDDEEEENEDELIQSVLDMIKLNVNEKPKNKQIERVKNLHKKKSNKNSNKNIQNKQQVYQDANVFYSTPKKNTFVENKIEFISQNKRTPLGCVENKLRVRSKSTETILKNKNGGKDFGSNYFDENLTKPTKHISVYEIESENNSFII